MSASAELLAFNRGVVSKLALARLDLKRIAMSAEIQANFLPRDLGPMMLRPGWKYTGAHPGLTKTIPFMKAVDDTADIEMSDELLRIWVDDSVVVRHIVNAAFTNGDFSSGTASWTSYDEAGSVSAASSGLLLLAGNGTAYAIREQVVAVSFADHDIGHALRVVVTLGPVILRVGSASLGDQFLKDTTLGTGVHDIVVVPNANMYVQLRNNLAYTVQVDSIAVNISSLSLPTPYGEDDLPYLRWDQSGDVIYLACRGFQHRKIERRTNNSWSIVIYQPTDGPFRIQNVTPTTISSTGLSGAVGLTASANLFVDGHVGALFSLTSDGQRIATNFTAQNTFGSPIRVTGVGDSRRFAIIITGTFVATVTLQRSVGAVGSWEDLSTYTTVTNDTYDDALDNQVIFYRLGVKTGAYTSGTAATTLQYSLGSITGVVLVTAVSTPTGALGQALSTLGGTTATDDWAEGLWSEYRGWPSAVAFHDNRLFWAGKDKFVGSVSDIYESFDESFEGDAGPISKSIGSGPVDTISWLMSLTRLAAGADAAIVECKSTNLDEPLTPTNFTPKRPVTRGCARVTAVKVDDMAIVVERSTQRVRELSFSYEKQGFVLNDLTALAPTVCSPGVAWVCVQREPDTRVHCGLTDGTVAMLVYEKSENVLCWVKIETDGEIVDGWVQPGPAGSSEDSVYYSVLRTVNGSPVYYREKWALESEAHGGVTNKMADSFVYYSGGATATIPVAHLEGEEVIVWGNGVDMSPGFGDEQTTYPVTGGNVTLPSTVTTACVGKAYGAQFKSTKLGYLVQPGRSGLGAKKHLDNLGLILADTHAKGLRYGQDFDTMDDLPQVIQGATISANLVHEDYEEPVTMMPGKWRTDSRLCLAAYAPRPCTVLAAVIDMETHPKKS